MSLASLIQQARGLVMADTEAPVDEMSPEELAAIMLGGGAVPDITDTEDDDTEESNPRYSTAMTLEYYTARDSIIASVWGGETSGQTSVISDYINDFVERRMADGRLTAFPSADQLLNDPDFINGAWATRFRAAGAPSTFIYQDDSGNSFFVSTIGEPNIFPMNVTRDMIEGQAPAGATGVDPSRPISRTTASGSAQRNPEQAGMDTGEGSFAAGSITTSSGATIATLPDAIFGNEEPAAPETPSFNRPPPQASVQGVTMNDVDADRRLGNRVLAQAATNLPTLNTSALSNLLSGGRGGGGGGGRQALVFDTDQMKEATREVYRRWYRADPDDRKLESIAAEYARKANAFWMGKGGRLDFDTFVRERLRNEPQYNQFFQFRPPSVDEDTFVAEFAAGIGSLGLRGQTAEREIARSMQSGGSAAAQTLRVSRTREASLQAGFGRRFGNTVQQLGRLG